VIEISRTKSQPESITYWGSKNGPHLGAIKLEREWGVWRGGSRFLPHEERIWGVL